uniref:Protein kinase domain-containing protein n=1 Tax=Globisporangium ultimum (strain ATCC 200006 / CBS 805.95 / DAOM BR144) TaxID=431595 RepID=K3XB69_GLOUD
MKLLREARDALFTPSKRARLSIVSSSYGFSQNDNERVTLVKGLKENDSSGGLEKKLVLYEEAETTKSRKPKNRGDAKSVILIDDINIQRLQAAPFHHETLRSYLQHQQNRQLTWRKLYEAACTLGQLHEQKIVHGRLQCSNILISTDGTQTARVRNFGPHFDHKQEGAKNEAVRWSAPECLRGANASCASDVFAFGMCILEAVTREDPWGCVSPSVVRVLVPTGRLPQRPVDTIVSDEQWDLIVAMCAKDPSRRLSMAQVIKFLWHFMEKEQARRVQLQREVPCVLYDVNSV